MNDWALTEDQIRAKVVELYQLKIARRMDLWLFSGISAGVIDADIAERVMNEELPKLPHDVRVYWTEEPCDCHGALIRP